MDILFFMIDILNVLKSILINLNKFNKHLIYKTKELIIKKKIK